MAVLELATGREFTLSGILLLFLGSFPRFLVDPLRLLLPYFLGIMLVQNLTGMVEL